MVQPPLLWSFSSFVVVGAIATGIQYAILIALVEGFAVDPVAASVTGYLLSAIANYALNYCYSFRSERPHREALPRFAFVAGVGLALNGVLMAALVRGFGLAYVAAQVLTTGIVLLWSFPANRVWSFAPSRSSPPRS